MLKKYYAEKGKVTQIEETKPGCWICLINPTETEINDISREFEIDADTIRAALDEEERPRLEVEPDYTFVLINIPIIMENENDQWYDTIPLSIIITNDVLITVCLQTNAVIESFIRGRMRDFYTYMKTRFILQLLYRNSSLFLQYLRSIDKKSEIVEKKLHVSTKNKELIELLKLEKSLVYFTTALRSNEAVLEKLLKTEGVKKYPEDTELLEDVIIENKQAIEMANIYSGILSGMMDAFASVISNNLNIVMKFLAVITIIMSIPTMIFSAYGMNVSENGFLYVITFSFVLTFIASVILSRKYLK